MALPLFLVVCVVAVAVGAGVGWTRRRVVVVDPPARSVLVRLRARSSAAVLAGLVLGGLTATAMLLVPDGTLGRLASMAPTAGGIVAVLVVAIAELTTPHLEGDARTASLESRRRRDAVDVPAAVLALGTFLTLALALGVGWAMGSADDMGRPGRAIVASCGATSSGAGPWPGSFYGAPMLSVTGVLAVATVVAVAAVAQRPRVGATSLETDTRLRKASSGQILRVSTAAAAGALVPVAGLMSSEVLGLACRPWWSLPFGILAGIVMLLAAGLAAGCLGTALWGPRLVDRAEEPAVVR